MPAPWNIRVRRRPGTAQQRFVGTATKATAGADPLPGARAGMGHGGLAPDQPARVALVHDGC